MKTLIELAVLYFGGCILVTWLICSWDSSFRPGEDEKMSWQGIVCSVALVILSWCWIIGLVWLGGSFVLQLVK